MNRVLRLSSSGNFTCYSFSSKNYDRYICLDCTSKRRIYRQNYGKYSVFTSKHPLYSQQLNNKKSIKQRLVKKEMAELVKVTKSKTTEMKMPVDKLNASHVTAFAEQPGMILHNLRTKTNNQEHENVDLQTIFDSRTTLDRDGHYSWMPSFIDVCIHNSMLEYAYQQLIYNERKAKILSTEIYNTVLQAFSNKGNHERVRDIMIIMKKYSLKYDCQTYAIYLDSLGRNNSLRETHRAQLISAVLERLTIEGFKISDLFANTNLTSIEREHVLSQIRIIYPKFEIPSSSVNLNSNCHLVAGLYVGNHSFKSPFSNISPKVMDKYVEEQMNIEKKHIVQVKSALPSKLSEKHLDLWNYLSCMWRKSLYETFTLHLNVMKLESKKRRPFDKPTLYPYLSCLPPEKFVDLMLEEISSLTSTSEYYSSPIGVHYLRLSNKIWHLYNVSKVFKNVKVSDELAEIYKKYTSWYLRPEGIARNSRQKWQMILEDNPDAVLPSIEYIEWPSSIKQKIGKLLYNIILKTALIPTSIIQNGKASDHGPKVPAFYLILRSRSGRMCEEIKCNPAITKLYKRAKGCDLFFESTQLPMLCPPKPWNSTQSGGYLVGAPVFIREYSSKNSRMLDLKHIPSQQLYPVFDSLNQLQTIPWRVNEEVLDIALRVFLDGKSNKLNVPTLASQEELSKLPSKTSRIEAYEVYRERQKRIKTATEDYSLWCEALYKISLANHYRKRIFWLPQNLDFRGRVYPIPPHVSHLCGDLYRSFLMFAKKEPLGKIGFDWLKIHVINLAGSHKKRPNKERLSFANEILPEIVESATNPLKKDQWWTKSENPWQTLAACIEIKKALDSKDPEKYESGLPIHQDGSCNGLQHYAALGRDAFGAQSVNLTPSDEPNDLYSVFVNLIEEARVKDAANGVQIAKVLEGYVLRKVVKQTIMTTVYGVTHYGARQQIAGQLRDIETFPEEKVWEAALYLSVKVFECLERMFTSAKQIQDWFIKCADTITKNHGQMVTWVTPLGLPVSQPYCVVKNDLNSGLLPNTKKQRNAFPPNFIHSLDSSHMMLTSLFCERVGLTFAAVHDCFWTHARSVDQMNIICRRKFIELHSEGILQRLSQHFNECYSLHNLKDEKKYVNEGIFSAVPETGNFDLNSVSDSEYFFS